MIENVSSYLIDKPLVKNMSDKSPGQILTYASDSQIPGLTYYAQIRWITSMPQANSADSEIVCNCDKIVLYWGNDYKDPEKLGAEIVFPLDGSELRFKSSTSIYIPKGIKHGPASWEEYKTPHIEMTILINSGNLNCVNPVDNASELNHISNPENYIIRKPAYEVVTPTPTKNRMHPSMTFLSADLIPGADTYLEFAWIWDIPDPDPHIFEHVHDDSNELVFHIGSNPEDPEDLGAEIEFFLDGKPLLLKRTSALYAPKTVKHGPLKWKSVTKPHIEMAVVFGAGNLAQSDPGGHQKKL